MLVSKKGPFAAISMADSKRIRAKYSAFKSVSFTLFRTGMNTDPPEKYNMLIFDK